MQKRLPGSQPRSLVIGKRCEIAIKIPPHLVSNLYDLALHGADTGLKGFEARQTELITLYHLKHAGLLSL